MWRRISFVLLFTCTLLSAPNADASVTLNTANTTALSNGLVGYWTFDGPSLNWRTNTVSDISGNGNTGTLVSMSTTTSPVAGKIGQALKFSGNTNYVSFSDGSLPSGSNPSTQSAWVYPTQVTANKIIMWYGTGSSSAARGMEILSSAHFRFFGYGSDCDSNITLPLNKWSLVVASYDGTTQRTYVNGIPGSTCTLTWNTTLGRGVIGRDIAWGQDSRDWVGTIDDVRIYNRALSATEVALLHAVGSVNVAHSNTVALSNGLVGYWTFDGGATHWNTGKTDDVSGNGNTGTLVSMSTTTSPTPGKIGQALKFNGGNYVTAGNAAVLEPTSALTYCMWLKYSALPSTYQAIGGMSLSGVAQGYLLDYGSTVEFQIGNGTWAKPFAPSPPVIGAWEHYCGVWTGTTVYLYRNGILTGTPVGQTSITYTGTTLNIGIYGSNGSHAFTGSADDVRIYNRALSAQEVQQLYQSGTANINHSNTVALSNGLVGYWTFDGGATHWNTGKTDDVSGNGNTGSLVNMSTTTSPVAGKIGQALKFNGGNQYVNIANSNSFGITTGDFAVSFWMKANQWSGYAAPLSNSIFSSGHWDGFHFENNPGNSGIGFALANSTASWNSALATGKWYHVVGVRSLGTSYIYINGVAGTNGNAASDNINVGRNYLLGRNQDNSFSRYFQGIIDDVRVYNRALSAQEVQQLYSMGR